MALGFSEAKTVLGNAKPETSIYEIERMLNLDGEDYWDWLESFSIEEQEELSDLTRNATEPLICQDIRNALDAAGIANSINEVCCGSCGHYEMAQDYPDRPHAFINTQTVDSVVEYGAQTLYIGFGNSNGEDRTAGEAISQALMEAGLNVDWNGSGETTILVHV